MRTYVYIDGFNLYYRGIKHTPYKWLDLKELCSKLLKSDHNILSIKYFTAMVSAMGDPNRPIRQRTYIRALEKHIPEFRVYYGTFLTHKIKAPLVTPINGMRFVEVFKTEEKGSDVNLAVQLLNDAWMNLYDSAVILSNDSDLEEAIRLVREQHKKNVGLFIPPNCFPSRQLIKASDFQKHIRHGVLANSQLPNPIPGTSIHKPLTW